MVDFSGITLTKTAEKEAGVTATFEVGPLPKGYGNTLGNTLRRVLLSSLEGSAITSVRINNLTHEYTTIPGVKQNVLDIVLRLKNVRIYLTGEDNAVITLTKKGKGLITAGDFAAAKNVEIINKDYVIAEITDDSASLAIEAIVEKGVGYKRAEESLRDEIGRIPVDTVFSPVRVVDFTVLPARKGAQADLDKVVVTITTDGTVSPESSLQQVGGIMRAFYSNIAVVLGSTDEKVTQSDNTLVENWKLSDIGLNKKALEKLTAVGVETLTQATEHPKTYFTKEVGLTAKQVKELEELMEQYNLAFAKDEKKSKKD